MKQHTHWGFRCRDCNEVSKHWFSEPSKARQAFHKGSKVAEELVTGELVRDISAEEMEVVYFISWHDGHDVWIEDDKGEVRLQIEAPTSTTGLPSHGLGEQQVA